MSALKATDRLVAEIALRAKRVTEAEVLDCLLFQEEQAKAGKSFSLGQILIKRHKLAAEEFVEVARRLEEPLLACADCGEKHAARALDESENGGESGTVCPKCGKDFNVAEAVTSLPDAAVAMPAKAKPAGPLGPAPQGPERGQTGAARRILLGGAAAARGRKFGRYEILETVGIGGMGVVYRARQTDLDRIVALKVLREGEGARDDQVRRFIREAQAAAKLQHPNIVAIHEVGLEEGIHYFTMDFIEGETLHEKFARGERAAPRDAAKLIGVLGNALHFAHQRGIVHRDLKPGNILITPEGVAKITDFGLAKHMGTELFLTRSGAAIGTPLYMSPEQARGDLRAIDARADVFSLGILLYQAMTGQLPFQADSHIELYNKILYEDPEDPRRIVREIPKDLQTICLKALEKKPADRYQTAKELAEDLERAAKGEPIRARPLGALERIWRAAKRQRTLGIVAATALLVAGAGWYLTLTFIERKQADAEAAARAKAAAEARGLLGSVETALREGRTEDALERAQVLFARFPESEEASRARLLEGEALVALGRIEDALAAYARAYRRAPGEAGRRQAMTALADTFLAARDHDRALIALEKVGGARAALRTGEILAELDDPAGARAKLEAALADMGGDPLGPDERRDAEDALAWLRDISPAIELAGAEAAATGDVDGDGRLELLALRQGTLVALSPGPEGPVEVARGTVVDARDAVFDVIAADVTGDAQAEAIVAARQGDGGPALLVCGFTPATPTAPASFAVLRREPLEGRMARGSLGAGDVDGDGRQDLVVATSAAGGPEGGGGVWLLRSARDATFQRIPIASDLSARGAVALAVLAADLDRDGRAEVVVGTGGVTGDDARIYSWNPGGGGVDVEWRQRVGPVAALAAADLDGEGGIELVLGRAPTPAGVRREYRYIDDGVHVFRPVEAGKSYVPAAAATPPGRIRALAAGDVTASGAPSIIVLVEPIRDADDDERLVRTVLFLSGYGPGTQLARRALVFRDRPVEWIRCADLDADGDSELVVGGPAFMKIYGLRGPK